MQPRLDFNGAYRWSVREHRELLRVQLQEVEPRRDPEVPVFDGSAHRGKVAQAAPSARGWARTGWPSRRQIDLEAKQAVDRLRMAASVFHAAELNVARPEKAQEMTDANTAWAPPPRSTFSTPRLRSPRRSSSALEALHAHANARVGLRYVTGQDPAGHTPRPHPPPRRPPTPRPPRRGRSPREPAGMRRQTGRP